MRVFSVSPFDLTLTTIPVITVDATHRADGGICHPHYTFSCSIEHSENQVFFDVKWHADGQLVKEYVDENAIAFGDMPVTLTSQTLVANGFKFGTTVRNKNKYMQNNVHKITD